MGATERPWGIANADHRPNWRNGEYRIDANSVGGDSPFVANGDTPTECRANAELIVRAVNAHDGLVAACQTARLMLQEQKDRKWAYCPATLEKLESALAAVEGKSG